MRLIDADAFEITHDRYDGDAPNGGLYLDGVEDVLLSIDDAPTITPEPGWISVKDRLPENGKDILAYLNNGEETRIAPCNYYNGVWYDSVMNCICVMKDVTHWMSLPEPPKGENT